MSYDKTIGYSSIEDEEVNSAELGRIIAINFSLVTEFRKINKDTKILVAGTGQGYEAREIKSQFGCTVIGVDNMMHDSHMISENGFILDRQDLTHLKFENEYFDIIYCNHVLEHVGDHKAVVKELYRVLKKDGVVFMGFPNKSRLLGYISSHQKISFADKIKWNANDIKLKLQGKFENNLGAHAGFDEKEFIKDFGELFSKIKVIRFDYMLNKYKKYQSLIKMLRFLKIDNYLFPSNYFVCLK